MIGFKLNEAGDVVFMNDDIALVDGNELLRQTIQQVLSTNKGEWEFDTNEGINFYSMLTKKPVEEVVRSEIQDGVSQVDASYTLTDFSMQVIGRELIVKFQAKNASGETLEGETTYAG